VSFNKGCYVGQEVIARLDAYDKVQRQLVLLHVGKGEIGNEGTLTVVHGENVLGKVTSLSPPLADGSRMALAICRKGSDTQPGVRLQVLSGTAALTAHVRRFMDPGPDQAETP